MGRKTYESIFGYLGRPLPGRTTIVITNKDRYDVPEGVYVVNDIPSAVQKAQACPGAQEIFVIGGASVYSQALNLTDRLYITHIEQAYAQADCFFPEFDTLFTLDTAIRHEGAPAYTFARYRKQ